MHILIIDNYDSFTYNLRHYCDQFAFTTVVRNDEITLEQVKNFDRIILSPGPGLPGEAGITNNVIRKYAGIKPILGVCLGLQCIAEVFGGKLINLEKVLHGVTSTCRPVVNDEVLFKGLPDEFEVGHYHSWVADETSLPAELEITAKNEDGLIMGLRHKFFDIRGVQFHPESVLTIEGLRMMGNWIK